jgi:Cu/Ag efflux protein CusF
MAALALAGLGLLAPGARASDYTEDMVQAVDQSKNTITLGHGEPMHVGDSCKVTMNGKSASMSDVKEGQKVRVAIAAKEGGSPEIVEIWILPPAGGTSTGSGSSSK